MNNQIDIDILETAIAGEAEAAGRLQAFLSLQKSIFSAKCCALGQKEVEAVQFADQYVDAMANALLEWGHDTVKSHTVQKGYAEAPRPMATEVQLQMLKLLMPSQLDEGLERIVANNEAKSRRDRENAQGITRK